MINLYTWALQWQVPAAAVDDLRHQLGLDSARFVSTTGKDSQGGESYVGAMTRLTVAQQGGLLWRNNVGAMQEDSGRVVRYGLANESKKMNQRVKSSDYIGVIPVLIEPHHVGATIGQFLAIETKAPGWKYNSLDEHQQAQLKFIELVVSKGGRAFFNNNVDGVVINQ